MGTNQWGSGWVLVGLTDFNSAGVRPSACAEGSTPLHSRQFNIEVLYLLSVFPIADLISAIGTVKRKALAFLRALFECNANLVKHAGLKFFNSCLQSMTRSNENNEILRNTRSVEIKPSSTGQSYSSQQLAFLRIFAMREATLP